MKRSLLIPIECGETTCASEPGKFCQYTMTTHFGTRYHCGLFVMQELKTSKPNDEGWLLRCKECLAHEVKNGGERTMKPLAIRTVAVGDTVQYQSAAGLAPWAAIVVRVCETDLNRVDLVVFDPRGNSTSFSKGVLYNEEGKVWTWRWSTRPEESTRSDADEELTTPNEATK